MQVIIDGDCNFCLWASVILRRLCKPGLQIIPMQDVPADTLIQWQNNPFWALDSIKVVSQGHLFVKSSAVSEVLKSARWYAQPLRIFFILPKGLLDIVYDWVARHRKGINCELPQKS